MRVFCVHNIRPRIATLAVAQNAVDYHKRAGASPVPAGVMIGLNAVDIGFLKILYG